MAVATQGVTLPGYRRAARPERQNLAHACNPAPVVGNAVKHTQFPCIVGAFGWNHESWCGTYYPPDLPPEWRLAYYANDFNGVLVPAAQWQTVSAADGHAWAEDVQISFRFLFEYGARALPDAWPEDLPDGLFGGWVDMAPAPVPGHLRATGIEDAGGDAEVILLEPGDVADRRALGRRLVALAARQRSPVALIGTRGVHPDTLRELRLLAELSGLS